LGVGNPVPSYTDLELTVVQSSPAATVSNNLVYTIGLTNYGPAPATGVVISDMLPAGLMAYVSNNFGGTMASNNGVLTFSTNSLAVGAGLSFNLALMPEAATTVTNMFLAVDGELEGSTNNFTNMITSVGQPSADLGVTLNAGPNPVVAGNYVTITLAVTNNGPSIAYQTVASNYLPAGLMLTASNVPAGTTLTNYGATNVWTIGSLPPYTSVTLTLTAKATAAGGATVLDSAVVDSPVTYDPFKLNNYASFKIVIGSAPNIFISSSAQGRTNTFTWANAATNYVLLGATNLNPPVVWVKVTNVVPSIVGTNFSITLPNTNGLHFYILTTP
jgi:uncharacterized repeat protein (TIGR01451 family)